MLKVPPYLDEVIGQAGTVVVPSRQRAHALRLAYAAARLEEGRRVWPSPDALPLEGWLTREIERHAGQGGAMPRLLSSAEEWLLWRQSTADATAGVDLVNRAALAAALRRASSLGAELGIDLRTLHGPPGTESALFVDVRRAVEERCRALGAASAAGLLERVPCVGRGRPVAFAGFLGPSARLRAIGEARARHGFETAYPAMTDPRTLVSPAIVRPADELEELERIADWCRQHLARQADARVLVVLPGSPGRRERLANLIRQAVDPRGALAMGRAGPAADSLAVIEGGGPLASLPAVSHALSSLALLTGGSLELERASEWLRGPWWAVPSPEWRARLDLWLRERGRLQLDLRTLLAVLRSAPSWLVEPATALATRLTEGLESLLHNAGTPRDWSERFRTALQALGWPGERPRGSAEQQTVVRFHELLDELGQLSAAASIVTRESAVEWLTELVVQTPFRPADDDAAVTISAALADPVVWYDAVWVAGLHAEAFPQPAQPDPFLPHAAQLSAGWPAASAAGRLEEARWLVSAWRAAAADLVLSAPARMGDIELLPSPLLEEWRSQAAPAEEAGAERAAIWLPARLHRPGLLREWRDDAGVAWDPQLPLPSGTRSLELQNQCPFRAYAELRLGSVELGVPEPGIAPDTRGQLLHAALQRLWERLCDSRALASMPGEELDELITECLASAAGALEARGAEPLARRALARECRRTGRLLRELCEIERERPPFRVQHVEYASRLETAGLELRIRIDRVDALEGGGLAILDYKSGKRVSADWYGERPSHPQLMAYLAAVGDGVVAMATVSVTAREVRFDGVASRAELLPRVSAVKGPQGEAQDAWPSRVSEWRGSVERLARDFAAGKAAVDPKPRACDFCHVASVCRVGDHAVTLDERGEDGESGSADD